MLVSEKMMDAAAWLTLKPYEWARKLPEHTPLRFFAEFGSMLFAVLAWPISIPLMLLALLAHGVEHLFGVRE